MNAHHQGWRKIAKAEIPGKVTFSYGPGGCPGTWFLATFIPAAPWPVGIVWYTYRAKEVDVLHSYVMPWARRLGLRTMLHKEMLRGYPDTGIITGASSSKASKRWLIKMGYKKKKRGWVLKI